MTLSTTVVTGAFVACLAVALGLYYLDEYNKEQAVSPGELKAVISSSACVRKALVQYVIDGRAISQGVKDETVKRCQVVDNQRKAFE